MKKILSLLTLLNLSALALFGQAEVDRDAEAKKMALKEGEKHWTYGGGLGLDLSGLGIANPRIGAGASRFGIGGLGTLFANKKDAAHYWDNSLNLQLSLQAVGQAKPTDATGFQKNLDMIRLTSRYGHKLIGEKIYLAVEGMLQTLLLKTYASNYLEPQDANDGLVAQLFAPATLSIAPGLDWRPNDKYSVFFAPASFRLVYVGNDDIARLNIHGNDLGKNNATQIGANLVAKYTNKYFKDRVTCTSSLNLFSNYKQDPQNVKVLWQNNLSIALFKGLSLDLLGELAYDHDVFVKKDLDGDGIYDIGDIQPIARQGDIPGTTGPDRLGRGSQFTGAFLLKYSRIF